MTEKPVKACRNCVNMKECRWFPELPFAFVYRESKYKEAMQIALEKLYAEYCHWYDKLEGAEN